MFVVTVDDQEPISCRQFSHLMDWRDLSIFALLQINLAIVKLRVKSCQL